MADANSGSSPDDRLTQMVQAAVSASLARRSAILKPREIQEITADARVQLEDLIRQRDADLQRMALLERAREKLQEEITGLTGDLQTRELALEEQRRASLRIEQRMVDLELEAEELRGQLAAKAAQADEVEGRIRGVAQEAEHARTAAQSAPEGTPEREQALERVRQLEEQMSLLREAREIMQREIAALKESLRLREGELEEERAAHRGARDRIADMQKQVSALADASRQQRGIEIKVFDEMSRAQENIRSMVDRLAGLEKSAEHGPVVAELRKEVDLAREESREDRVRIAQLQAQLRDISDSSARAGAAAAHLRETLAAVETDRDRLDDLLRRERRQTADTQRNMMRRLEELENRPPVGADPAAWDRLKGQFESRLKEAAKRASDLDQDRETLRAEMENARQLLTRATVERQTLRARVEALELSSVSPATGQAETLRAEVQKSGFERDEAQREVAALRSKVDALGSAAEMQERERRRLEEELARKTGGGFFRRLLRAFTGG